MWLRDNRAASARIAVPGYLIKLSKLDFRRIVQEVMMPTTTCCSAACVFKINDRASYEYLNKLANLFTERTANLVTERTTDRARP